MVDLGFKPGFVDSKETFLSFIPFSFLPIKTSENILKQKIYVYILKPFQCYWKFAVKYETFITESVCRTFEISTLLL